MPRPAPKYKLVQTTIATKAFEHLQKMAAEAGVPFEDLIEKLLVAIANDDSIAHGGEPIE